MNEAFYADGAYLESNPTLHVEDSDFKYGAIRGFLNRLLPGRKSIRILDVGGGGGRLGYLVAEHFQRQGVRVVFTALDLSPEMLAIQSRTNPHIRDTVEASLLDCDREGFDLVLMMDVLEHIPAKEDAAKAVNRIADHAIYNVPVERNLADMLKNVYSGGRYYEMQRRSLGHVHFFSYRSCRRFMRRHHRIVDHCFVPYCNHILSSEAADHVRLKSHPLTRGELLVSNRIRGTVPALAPYLIQGSTCFLVKCHA
jgi:SAM-dependent methyltransferase